MNVRLAIETVTIDINLQLIDSMAFIFECLGFPWPELDLGDFMSNVHRRPYYADFTLTMSEWQAFEDRSGGDVLVCVVKAKDVDPTLNGHAWVLFYKFADGTVAEIVDEETFMPTLYFDVSKVAVAALPLRGNKDVSVPMGTTDIAIALGSLRSSVH